MFPIISALYTLLEVIKGKTYANRNINAYHKSMHHIVAITKCKSNGRSSDSPPSIERLP